MKRLPTFIVVVCVLLSNSILHAQERTEIGTLAADFINTIRASATEKAFVHSNRWTCSAGDSIWLKAYCINAATLQYMGSSKNMYVDLVDEQDSLIKSILLDIPSQRTDAVMAIPASLPGGQYWLRAYTQRMLKGDSSGIFLQPVYISNPAVTKPTTAIKTPVRPLNAVPPLVALAEGGSLISGFDNWVAIQTTDESGKPASRSGYIKDSRDSIVARFTTSANGLAKIVLLPWKNRRYTAWTESGGQKRSFSLPAIDPNAAALVVSKQDATSMHVTVALGDSLYEKKPSSRLLVLNRDHLLYAANGKGMYELDIPVRGFPEGRTDLVLASTDGKILSQRSVFEGGQPYLRLQTDKASYKHKEKAVINMIAADSAYHSDIVRLSVAVSNRNEKEAMLEASMVDRLVHNNISLPVAGMHIADYSKEEQDILMLLQRPAFGSEKPVAAPAADPNTQEQNFSVVTGSIRDKKNMPAPGKVVVLKMPGNSQMLYTETADSLGKFRFAMPDNISDADLTLELANERSAKQTAIIVPDRTVWPAFRTPARLKEQFSNQQLQELKQAARKDQPSGLPAGDELQNVDVVTAPKKQPAIEAAKRYSMMSYIAVLTDKDKDDPMSPRNLVLRAPGVSLRDGFLMINGGPNSTSMPSINDEPLVVMDGAPVSAGSMAQSLNESSPVLNMLSSLQAGSIDFIEILSGPSAAAFGERGANGVISINTSHDIRQRISSEPGGITSLHYQGYTKQAVFPAADYSKKGARSGVADKRRTIYWNGDILTQKNGHYQFALYTGDLPDYSITIFGLSPKGDIIYQQQALPVGNN